MTTTPFRTDDTLVVSPETGSHYVVTVEVPSRYRYDDDTRYPVVVCLDGWWTFGAVRDAFRIQPLGRELPEAIVVAVSHADADIRRVIQLRAVDFTPTPAAAPPETGVTLPAAEVGRADRFRRFLVDRALPSVAERFRISDDRTLVGHSFSALFGLDTLLAEPDAFGRWVLASPSVWWDDRIMFAREEAHAASATDLPARVFLSRGGLEDDGAFGGQEAFHDRLAARRYPNLDLRWRTFGGESHQSVIGSALTRGLREVFTP